MHDVERVTWTSDQQDLLRRIEAHPLERPDHILDFTKRLARDRGWSLDFARGAVLEYRRFCFLAMVFDTPVTPSEEVDEVWHQHLTYSRDYWDVWCGRVLQRPLHHDPTEGGPSEQGRYRMQYAETLARYEAFFGPPDPLFWPATHRRFRNRPRYRIVDGDRVLALPRPALHRWLTRAATSIGLALAGLGLTPRPALALPPNPLDWTAGPFLTFYVCLAIATLVVAHLVRDHLTRVGPAARPNEIDLLGLAYLAGGYRRAADTVILGLMEAGAASLATPSGRIIVADRDTALPPHLEPFRGAAEGETPRSELIRALEPRLEPVRKRLIDLGLAPSPGMLRRMAMATPTVVLPVVVLGIAKMLVGSQRGKPIGFLVVLTLVMIVPAAIMMLRHPTRTDRGNAVLDRYRERYRRAARAPREGELLFAVAIGGTAVLAGTPYEAYGRSPNSSGDGGSGCGSDGGGGGGGGCGGCGGGD